MATLEIIAFLVALSVCASILVSRARWIGGGAWGSVFLVMLQDGVCASQSPISTSPRNSVVAAPEKKELLLTASNSS